jgi:hypothetical protein
VASSTHKADHVWSKTEQAPGRSSIPGFLAGTPVSVLAGFNFTSAILIVSQRPMPDHWAIWSNWASGLLFVGAAVFLIVLALAGRAQFVSMTPEQAVSWWPELALDKDELTKVRNRVWTAEQRTKGLITTSTRVWVLGLVLTAAGAATGLLSYGTTHGHICVAVALGVSMVIVALVYFINPEGAKSTPAQELSDRATELMLRAPEVSPLGQTEEPNPAK